MKKKTESVKVTGSTGMDLNAVVAKTWELWMQSENRTAETPASENYTETEMAEAFLGIIKGKGKGKGG